MYDWLEELLVEAELRHCLRDVCLRRRVRGPSLQDGPPRVGNRIGPATVDDIANHLVAAVSVNANGHGILAAKDGRDHCDELLRELSQPLLDGKSLRRCKP